MGYGSISLFKDIFEEPPVVTPGRKGRSLSQIERRNELLIARYYWHGRRKIEGKQISYESLKNTISDEFFLSTVTVPEIIADNYAALQRYKIEFKEMSDDKIRKHFSAKWPHLVW